MFVVKLPIKPHLKKFLAYNVNIHPYVISRKGPFGKTIYHDLINPLVDRSINLNLEIYSETLEVKIPANIFHSFKCKIGHEERAALSINNYIDGHFKMDYRRYMDICLNSIEPKTKMQLTLDFMELYGITQDELQYDSMLRDYRRFVKKQSEFLNLNEKLKKNKFFARK